MLPSDEVREVLRQMMDYADATDFLDWETIDNARAWLNSLPTLPEPDWSQTPEWTQWWAVDADGQAAWYFIEPFLDPEADITDMSDLLSWHTTGASRAAGYVDLPLGIDWRLTLRQRPQGEEPQP